MVKSISFFILAGLFEIGGGYLIWLWLKEKKPYWYAIIGAVVLILYGFVATLQPSNFGRVYATYGGVFIIMAVLWAWKFDNIIPDRYDVIGCLFVLIGILIMMYFPRD